MKIDPQNDFLVIGHRGAAGLEPENTLPSFAKAFELGCRAIELDVYLVENDLIIIHDEDLKRTTNRDGRVSELKLSDLGRIDAGNGAPIPRLGEVLDLGVQYRAKGIEVLVNIELKGPNTASLVADFVAQYSAHIEFLVSSFNHDELATFCALDPLTPVAPLYGKWDENWMATASALNAKAVNLNAKLLTAGRTSEIREAGYLTFAYTVNKLRQAKILAAWGVNGVFTDRPDLLLGEVSL